MTNILINEIKKALESPVYFDEPCIAGEKNTYFSFKNVKNTLQKNPQLINSVDKNGNTLLHILIAHNKDIQGLTFNDIITYHPNPFIKNKEGLTPHMMLTSADVLNVQLSAYESSYQADCLASAIEAQSAILQHQVMEHQIYKPKTPTGYPLPKSTLHSPYHRQPQEVQKARNQLQVIVKKLRGTPNEME